MFEFIHHGLIPNVSGRASFIGDDEAGGTSLVTSAQGGDPHPFFPKQTYEVFDEGRFSGAAYRKISDTNGMDVEFALLQKTPVVKFVPECSDQSVEEGEGKKKYFIAGTQGRINMPIFFE